MTQQSMHKTSPKFSMSARIPPRELKKGMPGPGNYGQTNVTLDKYKSSPKISIAGANREGKEWGVTPGPGQYKPPLAGKTMPSFGFGSEARLHAVKESRGPGPGSYETRGNLEGLKFSVSSRPSGTSNRSLTPAPGQYKPDYGQIEETAPKSSFGGSSRAELAPSKQPGPGQYELMPILGGNISMRAMPRYTIQGKYNLSKTDVTPGPGAAVSMFTR